MAAVVQVVAYLIARAVTAGYLQQITENGVAAGIFTAGISISVGTDQRRRDDALGVA